MVATKVTGFSGRSDRAEAARRMMQAVQGTERGGHQGATMKQRSTIKDSERQLLPGVVCRRHRYLNCVLVPS